MEALICCIVGCCIVIEHWGWRCGYKVRRVEMWIRVDNIGCGYKVCRVEVWICVVIEH